MSEPVILTFLGMPGAGKSTQTHLLTQKYHFTRISPGEILRSLAVSGEASELRARATDLLRRNSLMPDDLLISVITIPLLEAVRASHSVVLDGVPASIRQFSLLKDALGEQGLRLTKAIHLTISPVQSQQRAVQRMICKNCQAPNRVVGGITVCGFCGGDLTVRSDDTPDTINQRWRDYQQNTEPLIQEFKRMGKLVTVSSNQTVDMIFAQIVRAIQSELICADDTASALTSDTNLLPDG